MDTHVSVEDFNAELWKRFRSGKIRNVYPLSKYNDIIEKIKTLDENPPCNTPGEYYLFRKFIVVTVGGRERLACKPVEYYSANSENKKRPAAKTKFYVALEEIYTYLDEAHKSVKHGCRDRICRRIQSQGIVNITRDTAELYLSFCKFCVPKKGYRRSASDVWEILKERSCESPDTNDENINMDVNSPMPAIIKDSNAEKAGAYESQSVCTLTRGFVDLIDFTLSPDGDYHFVFVYIDIQTCFCVLHPMRCKCTHEIVSHLLSIFSLIGSPQVLHSNFDAEFLTEIIQLVKQASEILIVCGATNYTELQEVAERCVSEVDSMLRVWMSEKSSNRWSFGLKQVQLMKNTKLPSNGTKCPFECFFGRPAKPSNLPPNIDLTALQSVLKEEELLSLVNSHSSSHQQPCEHLQVSVDPDICNLVQNDVRGSDDIVTSQAVDRQSPVVKIEPVSDSEFCDVNGFEMSDSSNGSCSPSNVGNLEIVIKEEVEDS